VRPIATPAYLRIADGLRRAILDGDLPPGSQLPSVPEIAREHGVSTRTAYEATKILLNEGLTTSRPGAGSYVRDRPAIVRMVRSWYVEPAGGSPWRAEMAAQGRIGSWEAHSEATSAPPAIAERLGIEPGARVMRTRYVFLADGQPTYLSVSWEPMAITGGTAVCLPEGGPHAGKGVAARMALIGHPISHLAEEIVPRPLTGPEAEQLGLRAGIAIVEIQRTYHSGTLPVETADIVLPPPYRARYEIPVRG
jgi:DNA-binding GntR family transcriptional regulator